MPRIPPQILNSVFFLYETEEDAKAGSEVGGTGFIVSLPAKVPGYAFAYFVTNWHNALGNGCSVVRLETVSGTPDIFVFDPTDWHYSTKYDIAVVHDLHLVPDVHRFNTVDENLFLTKELKEKERVGPGEDVFMVGRFVDNRGSKHNVPAVRFGNISMDPVPIKQVYGGMADSYTIDMRSRPGFSGSPVFLYRTMDFDLEHPNLLWTNINYLWLLGIHWGQFREEWQEGDLKIERPSGMTCVLPAWTILEVLNMPELKKERDIANARLKEALGNGPVAEAVTVEGDAVKEGDALLAKMLNTPKAKS